jgi:hypothetical protein
MVNVPCTNSPTTTTAKRMNFNETFLSVRFIKDSAIKWAQSVTIEMTNGQRCDQLKKPTCTIQHERHVLYLVQKRLYQVRQLIRTENTEIHPTCSSILDSRVVIRYAKRGALQMVSFHEIILNKCLDWIAFNLLIL